MFVALPNTTQHAERRFTLRWFLQSCAKIALYLLGAKIQIPNLVKFKNFHHFSPKKSFLIPKMHLWTGGVRNACDERTYSCKRQPKMASAAPRRYCNFAVHQLGTTSIHPSKGTSDPGTLFQSLDNEWTGKKVVFVPSFVRYTSSCKKGGKFPPYLFGDRENDARSKK